MENNIIIVIQELCEYTDLGTLIKIQRKKNQMFSEAEILNLIYLCCRVLAAAEDSGIVHGGIKPENILVKDGEKGGIVKIANFGISQVHDHFHDIEAIH